MDYKTVHWASPEGMAMHAIGMDHSKPYTRHGKLYYRPYRNRFTTPSTSPEFRDWLDLVEKGYAAHDTVKPLTFWLTRAGLDWLGETLGITIYDETE